MLEMLHIENIAIIESTEIAFEKGFNALTGETGAGKSIVIDAMNAVLGQRTSRDLIRTGAEKAFVSAWFSGIDPSICEDLGLASDEDGNLMLQREIFPDGKNVCRVGGRPVTVAVLKMLGNRLLNIHGQHDGQQLLDEEQHLLYLDRFGKTENAFNTYTEKYKRLTSIQRQIETLQMDEAEKARRVDTLKYQIEELERAKLRSGEEEKLTARRNLLRNGEKLITALSTANYSLNGDDSSNGALSQIKQAQEALAGIRTLDEDYAALYQRLNDAYSELYDISDIVRDQMDSFDFSPVELDEMESRLDLFYRLKKKYGATVEDMLAYLDKCRTELDAITDADDTLTQLEKERVSAEKEAKAAATALSAKRHTAALELSRQILEELRQLDMAKIRFEVSFDEKPLDASGMDDVRFLMSANVGEELKPINKIASGGELARIMLAMKNVLSEQDQVNTLVFDEVDTGVSGRAAQKVAEKMARISRHKQVLCVTHLPQLAAMADTHFSVEKGERDGRTYTNVQRLDHEQRKGELARLTGGSHVSETLLQSAEELLCEAEMFRKTLS